MTQNTQPEPDHGYDASSASAKSEEVLEELAAVIDDLSNEVAARSTHLTQLTADVDQLGQDVDALAKVLNTHLTAWDDIHQESIAWANDWLIPTFSLYIELEGWSDIPALRSEVQALFIGYRAMAAAKEASMTPLAWHDSLDRSIARIPQHRMRHTDAQKHHHAAPTTPNTHETQPNGLSLLGLPNHPPAQPT